MGDNLAKFHLSLEFLLAPRVLLVLLGQEIHLYLLVLSFPSDLYVHKVPSLEVPLLLWGGFLGLREGPPPPGGPPAPSPLPGSPGALLSVIETVSSSVSFPSSSSASPPSSSPSSGGPPPLPPGAVHLPPPEGRPNCSRHPLTGTPPGSPDLFFSSFTEGFPSLRGVPPGSGCHLSVGEPTLVVPL